MRLLLLFIDGLGIGKDDPAANPLSRYTSRFLSIFSDAALPRLPFDGIVIPGGYAPDRMRRHDAMVKLVRQIFDNGNIVAAICHAGWMLCSAGVLKGKEATSFSAIKDDMVNAGAKWVDRDVVRDGNLITSRTPDDLPAFMRAIIAACVESPEKERVAERSRHAG